MKIFDKPAATKLGRSGVTAAKAAKMIAAGEALMLDYLGEPTLMIQYGDTAPARSANAHGYRNEQRVKYRKHVPIRA